MRVAKLSSFSTPRDDRRAPLPFMDDEATEAGQGQQLDDFALPMGGLLEFDPNRPVEFVGFNEVKLHAPLALGSDGLPKSAKYTFGKLAMTSRTMPLTRAQAEDWFNAQIRGGMEAAGFRVGWVKGDEALISTRENPRGEMIRFMRGAGSGIPGYTALAWQTEATQAAENEVTMMSEDPLGIGSFDPGLEAQRELARQKHVSETIMQREVLFRLRAERITGARW